MIIASTLILPFCRTSEMGLIHYPAHSDIPGKPSEPWLSVSGNWLSLAGFEGGQKLTIQCEWQRLIITPIDKGT